MVDSSSNISEVEAQYDDNADLCEEPSLAKAKLFAQACRTLIRRYKNSGSGAGLSYGRDLSQMRSELPESPVQQGKGST